MTGSFLSRHRTICEVLEEIRKDVRVGNDPDIIERQMRRIDEAKDYAQRMSAKLVQYKAERTEHGKDSDV